MKHIFNGILISMLYTNKRIQLVLFLLLSLLSLQTVSAESPFYQNKYTDVEQKIDDLVKNMTLDEKIGQMIMLSFRYWDESGKAVPVDRVTDDISSVVTEYHLGGVLVSIENCQTTEGTVRFTADLQHAAISSGNIPLLIASDEEGGIITRVEQDTTLPGNMAVGATDNEQCAFDCGKIIGEELLLQGINCTFAPVGDVNDNPNNPVINLRSFGSEPDKVARFTVAMQRGIESTGTIACVKHFPGHGNTATDSHSDFSVVNKTLDEWNSCERIPFALSIQSGIDMVMVAHVQVPALDDTIVEAKRGGEKVYLPATTSRRIVTETLRNQMHFNGVVVSDAMFMKSLSDVFGETEAVVKVVSAGVDLLCNPVIMTSDGSRTVLADVVDAIKTAVTDNVISEQQITDSVKRIVLLKYKHGILSTEDIVMEDGALEKKIARAKEIVGGKNNRAIEREIAEASVTLVNKNAFVQFKPKRTDTVLFLMPYENEQTSIEFAMQRLVAENTIVDCKKEYYCYYGRKSITSALKKKIASAKYIIILSYMEGGGTKDDDHWLNMFPQLVVKQVGEKVKSRQIAVISIGLPYDVVHFKTVPVFAVYNYVGIDERDVGAERIMHRFGPGIPAGVEAIFGSFVACGKMPVDLSKTEK